MSAQAQLSGTKAIPGSGSTGYATLAAAVADLDAQGVGTGGVTFNIAAGYAETVANLLLTATGTAATPLVFQPPSPMPAAWPRALMPRACTTARAPRALSCS